MTTADARVERQSWGLLKWALTQFALFAYTVVYVVVWGLVLSIASGRFRWRAYATGQVAMLAGIAAVIAAVFSRADPLQGMGETLLWGGSLAVMCLAGGLIAVIARRLGSWECYLAFLVVLGLSYAYLRWGGPAFGAGDDPFGRLRALFGAGGGDPGLDPASLFGKGDEYLAYALDRPPGERLFGPMWDRVLGIAAVGAGLLTLLGGSFGFLLFGEEGRFDPRLGVEWHVARRHLAGRKGWVSVTAVVAVLGVALGVAALVSVTALMSGYQTDVQDKILSTNAHLVVQKYGIDFVEYDTIAERALKVPGVLAFTPFSFNEAMLSDGDLGMGVLLKGIVPETAGGVTSLQENLCKVVALDVAQHGPCQRYGAEGGGKEPLIEMLRPVGGVPSAVIGVQLYKKLHLPLGAEIALTTPVGMAGARGTAPRRMHFRIGGVFQSGMHEFDSKLIYLHLSAAQELMGLGNAVNGVELKVQDPENVETVSQEVLDAVGGYPYRMLDWRQLNLGIFTALKLQKIVMFLVLCSIIVVGAFNIASTLFMAVVEKSREIGVLKSIGARDASIMRIFVLEGWMVGLIGTLAGVALGLCICLLFEQLDIDIAADVYMVDSLKVRVNPYEVLGTALAALGISHLATIYPALRAAESAPVDAMRYD